MNSFNGCSNTKGTPCVGKSRLANNLAEKLNFKWQDVSAIVRTNNFIESYDDELDCPIMNEDKLLDFLEPIMQEGGNIVEYHGCDFFPERWFHFVYVVRCNTDLLYTRLSERLINIYDISIPIIILYSLFRNYNPTKLQSNLQCEIFQIVLEEAMDSYKPEIISEVLGENEEQLNLNLGNISKAVAEWRL